MKLMLTLFKKQLLYIFNLSLNTDIFPQSMKFARVTPIFKGGDKSDVYNYRPIDFYTSLLLKNPRRYNV